MITAPNVLLRYMGMIIPRMSWTVTLAGFLAIGLFITNPQPTFGQLIEQVPGGTEDPTGDPVSVDFAPDKGDIPDTRTFADEIWPDGSAPIQLNPSRGHELALHQDGPGNRSDITQSGVRQVVVVVQEGLNNTSTITQMGTGHTALIHQETSNHTLDLTQEGSQNMYLLDFQSAQSIPSVAHEVVQKGSNLELYQVGSTRIPFNVKQQGNGMEMVIRHGTLP